MKKNKTILVAGGYGYSNLGDEAQCETTLELLTNRYSNYQIINLSPNVNRSKELHTKFFHDTASRVAFYNEFDGFNIFSIKFTFWGTLRMFGFILKSILILLNAHLVKYGVSTFFLNPKSVKFLQQLKEASLFYFCGGGYLTGKTLSRLLDGFILCRLCKIFNTPVVMSGQTIGIWNNRFNELLARWAFKSVKVITVRDEEFSLKDLEKIGLRGENYFATHDDALHCEKAEEMQINSSNYITLNFHYWGMKGKQKDICIDKINKIVRYVLDTTDFDIVLIPMTQSDMLSFNNYLAKYSDKRIIVYDYNIDFRKIRKVISESKMCITMKHHPIIFAMGENIPVISLAFSKYYVHKNLGALTQYGQEKFSINLEENNYFEQFIALFEEISANREDVVNTIKSRIAILDERKEKFMKKVDEILK